ncbi:hypothetical protein PMIT1320_00557 [Prochlorococcus marinus str. MIT 1320]|nr:hypothetical protein PMIT1320_00557 [Prochlorococcus marinus str. MIT 1320]
MAVFKSNLFAQRLVLIAIDADLEINQCLKAQKFNFAPDQSCLQSALRLIAING